MPAVDDEASESMAPLRRAGTRLSRAVGHHRLATLADNPSIVVHEADRNLGAANIDAENGLRFFASLMFGRRRCLC
jgi:hypothetical protein